MRQRICASLLRSSGEALRRRYSAFHCVALTATAAAPLVLGMAWRLLGLGSAEVAEPNWDDQ
jgi:hypothetical protein